MNHIDPKAFKRIYAAVVFAAIDDAIDDTRKDGWLMGVAEFESWANSKDGHQVLSAAGIEPGPRATEKMVALVRNGVKMSVLQNSPPRTQSNVPGVWWESRIKKWRATKSTPNGPKYLGVFDKMGDAEACVLEGVKS